MHVACAQLDIAWESQEKNYQRAEELVREAHSKNVQLLCLPELFSTGVTLQTENFAETLNGKTPLVLANLAKKFKMTIVGGFIKEGTPLPKNTTVIFNQDGERIAEYAKIHIFTYDKEDKAYSPGEELPIFKIDNFKTVATICYDLRFPELYRIPIEKEGKQVELILVCANWPLARINHWRNLLVTRAIENQVFVIGTNRAGNSPNQKYGGHSMIISPKGDILAEAGEKEELLKAELNEKDLEEWRETFPALKDRKPHIYKTLQSD